LRNDTGVGEPLAVWLDTSRGSLARLEDGGFCDVASGVALGGSFGEDVKLFDLLGISVRGISMVDEGDVQPDGTNL
jgi:hypothetical protein